MKKKLLYKLKKEINKSEYTQKNKLYLCKNNPWWFICWRTLYKWYKIWLWKSYDHVVQSFTNKDQTEGNLGYTTKFDNIKSSH